MPLFMDVHKNMKGISKEALEEAHKKDLAVQEKHEADFKSYWYNAEEGSVFCLCEAPNKEAVSATHREAHGSEADEVIEVNEGA